MKTTRTTDHRPTHTTRTRPASNRSAHTSIWALRATFAPRLFVAGVIVAGAAAVLAPIAGGHAEADVGDISVSDASTCDKDWLGADQPYVGVTIHNANPADPTPVEVLMFLEGNLHSASTTVITTDLTTGFNPLLVNEGRVEVREAGTTNVLFTTGDLKPCNTLVEGEIDPGGPVEGEVDPSGPLEATLPVTALSIHTCGSQGVTVGASVTNPNVSDTTVGVSIQTPSTSSSHAVAVAGGATVDKTTLVPYYTIVRVRVMEKGVTLLDTGDRVSFEPSDCDQPAPVAGAGLSFDLTADCTNQIPFYKLVVTNSAAAGSEPAYLTASRYVDGQSASTAQLSVPGGESKYTIQEAAFGSTFRTYVTDQFNRTVFDSGLLIATDDDCGVKAVHLVELDLDIECIDGAPVATTVVANNGHFPEERTVHTTVDGVVDEDDLTIPAGDVITETFGVTPGAVVEFTFYEDGKGESTQYALEMTAPSCTPAPVEETVPTSSEVPTTVVDTTPESTVVTESGDSHEQISVEPQADAGAPSGSVTNVPVAAGELPVTGGGWGRLPVLAWIFLSAGLLIARIARRGGWTR